MKTRFECLRLENKWPSRVAAIDRAGAHQQVGALLRNRKTPFEAERRTVTENQGHLDRTRRLCQSHRPESRVARPSHSQEAFRRPISKRKLLWRLTQQANRRAPVGESPPVCVRVERWVRPRHHP